MRDRKRDRERVCERERDIDIERKNYYSFINSFVLLLSPGKRFGGLQPNPALRIF